MDARIKSGHDGVEELCRWNREPYRRVLSANLTGQRDRFLNRERNRPIESSGSAGLGQADRQAGRRSDPFKRTLKMKKLMTILVAALALALVAFTPDLASAAAIGAAATLGAAVAVGMAAGTATVAGTAIAAGAVTAGAAGGDPASTSMWLATAAAAGRRPTAITPAAIGTAGGIRTAIGICGAGRQ